MNDILNIREGVLIDNSIEEFNYIEKDADQGTGTLNNNTELTVTFQNQDGWVYPHKSYLILEGTIQTAAHVNWADAQGAALAFCNNGLMFLFSNCKYFLGTQVIEYFENAGVKTTLHNYLTKSSQYKGMNWMWYPDTFVRTSTNSNDGFAIRRDYLNPVANTWKFSATILLGCIFNFCNDYRKVIYGMQHKIAMVRTNDTRALFRNIVNINEVGKFAARTSVANDATVNLTKLRWALPQVRTDLVYQAELLQIISEKIPVQLAFLNKKSDMLAVPVANTFAWKLQLTSGIERPRFLVIAFQTGRGANQTTNNAIFDSNDDLDVTAAHVLLNGDRYPYADMGTSRANNQYAKWYYNYLNFYNKYNNDSNDPCITMNDFYNFNTFYVFDVSSQHEKLKNTTIDTTVHMTFANNAPANTMAYALIYYDSLHTLTGDNNRQIITSY